MRELRFVLPVGVRAAMYTDGIMTTNSSGKDCSMSRDHLVSTLNLVHFWLRDLRFFITALKCHFAAFIRSRQSFADFFLLPTAANCHTLLRLNT